MTGSVALAAAAVPVERTMHYRWLKHPRYAAAFAAAQAEFGDVLEAAAIARAKDGVLEAVFYQGQACGAIRKYSDGLMVHLLKGFKPDKYSSKVTAEVNVTGTLDLVERLNAARKRASVAHDSNDPAPGESRPS